MELQQTKGSVRLEGKVVGFDLSNENTYREGITKKGEGVPFRSISTTIKTSNNNVIYGVDSFGQIPNKRVKIFSNKGGEKKNLEIDFKDRNLVGGEYKGFPDGFTCFGFGTIGTGFNKENNKIKMKNYYTYDGAEVLKNALNNDKSVWVDAEFNINTYEANGETKTNVKYTIQRIGLKDNIDFDAEDFKEVNSFEQEFVVVSTQYDKETKKLYVVGRVIGWDRAWKDATFVVDANNYEALAQNFYKKTKFGDLVKVQGKVINGTVVVEVEEAPEINWGGETPEGQGKKVNRNKISELQITNVLSHKAKVYKEDDFIVENPFVEESSNDLPWSDDADDSDPFK